MTETMNPKPKPHPMTLQQLARFAELRTRFRELCEGDPNPDAGTVALECPGNSPGDYWSIHTFGEGPTWDYMESHTGPTLDGLLDTFENWLKTKAGDV